MAKISARSEEVRSRSEFKCLPRLFEILDSQNCCPSPEIMISNKLIIADYLKQPDHHRTSFDEECRKIQYGSDLSRSSRANGSERSLSDLIRQDTDILQQKHTDSKLSDHVMESRKAARKSSRRAYESCLYQSNDATSSIHKQKHPPYSAAMPSNKLAIAAPVVCEGLLPMSSILLEKLERVDTNMQQQPQMSAKDFVDHIFAERKLICNKSARVEPKPFSNALEVLNSDKDLFMELLSQPYCLPHKCINNLQTCVTEKENGSAASFSVREMKRKLKHRFGSRRKDSDQLPKFSTASTKLFGHDCIYSGVETRNPLMSTTNAKSKEKLGGLKVEREPLVSETETARKKIDVSSDRLSEKHQVDASLEARLRDLNAMSRLRNPWRVLSSLEIDSCLSPRRESQYISGSAQVSLSPCRHSICLSPLRTREEVASPYDGTTDALSTETSSSLVPSTDDEEVQEAMLSPTPSMKFNDMPNVVETDDSNAQRAAKFTLHNDEYGGLMHSIMDSISENETFSNTVDDFPSTPTLDSTAYQEEYQSPVSVLDQFFTEDSSSPSNTAFQSARGTLKPRRLQFEEHNLPSSSQDTPITAYPCMHDDRDYTISNYVRLIFEASSLNWEQLSAIRSLSEHLLHPSLFDQARFLQFDSHFNTRLLFDHINEVLLETQRSHFVSPYWPAFAKPRICCLPLEEAVVDEIMREAEFYLLPHTQKRTLDQLVAKDFSGPRLRPDVLPETEEIIVHISEDILEESVLDVILELHS